MTAGEQLVLYHPAPTPQQSRAWADFCCPTCFHTPTGHSARRRQLHDLTITWLYTHPHTCDRIIARAHCVACQPHSPVTTIECTVCGDGPLLAGSLAEPAPPHSRRHRALNRWLTERAWRHSPALGWGLPSTSQPYS